MVRRIIEEGRFVCHEFVSPLTTLDESPGSKLLHVTHANPKSLYSLVTSPYEPAEWVSCGWAMGDGQHLWPAAYERDNEGRSQGAV